MINIMSNLLKLKNIYKNNFLILTLIISMNFFSKVILKIEQSDNVSEFRYVMD